MPSRPGSSIMLAIPAAGRLGSRPSYLPRTLASARAAGGAHTRVRVSRRGQQTGRYGGHSQRQVIVSSHSRGCHDRTAAVASTVANWSFSLSQCYGKRFCVNQTYGTATVQDWLLSIKLPLKGMKGQQFRRYRVSSAGHRACTTRCRSA